MRSLKLYDIIILFNWRKGFKKYLKTITYTQKDFKSDINLRIHVNCYIGWQFVNITND